MSNNSTSHHIHLAQVDKPSRYRGISNLVLMEHAALMPQAVIMVSESPSGYPSVFSQVDICYIDTSSFPDFVSLS